MRIWDLPPSKLCREHLLGEHRELHAIWSILTKNKRGYSNHPEVKRWRGRLKALFLRHEALVEQMKIRGYSHRSPLDESFAIGSPTQHEFLDSIESQINILKQKGCRCAV
ncbi:MAG: pyrimidine dimer DNA glycosylase/endonuclease V [Deltaproteobacteria bacterium]|nr:pyrimidine dimer DNA glycosylase/endonuclease V [Deltaproteobacteria bacterium]